MANRTSYIPDEMMVGFLAEGVTIIANDPTGVGGAAPVVIDLTVNQAGGYGGILTNTGAP